MKLIKISLLILISLRFDFSKACDPNENCMYLTIETCSTFERPFRVCRKRKEDLVCAAKRKLCQVNCSSINEDASNYISQYYSEIVRINSELTSLDNSIRYEQNNQENYLGSIQRLSLISENFKGTFGNTPKSMYARWITVHRFQKRHHGI